MDDVLVACKRCEVGIIQGLTFNTDSGTAKIDQISGQQTSGLKQQRKLTCHCLFGTKVACEDVRVIRCISSCC